MSILDLGVKTTSSFPSTRGTVAAAPSDPGYAGFSFNPNSYGSSVFNYNAGNAGAGMLSLSIPTNLLGGSTGSNQTGGLNLSFNLGPTMDTIAANAYNFTQSQANNAFAFLGNTISQSQSYVGANLAPIVSSVAQNQGSFFDKLLGAFNTGVGAVSDLGNAGLSVIQSNTLASIQASQQASQYAAQQASLSSQASSKASAQASDNGGGCYLTTAVCEFTGEADNGPTLSTLRKWRDDYLVKSEVGRACIARYYREAPGYVARINSLSEMARAQVYGTLRKFIRRSASAIRRGDNTLALANYMLGVTYAKQVSESII